MKRFLVLFSTIILITNAVHAQKFSEAIEDNSFLIEEAYNQEEKVVQHISTGYYYRDTKDFIYSFTQEWPAFGPVHQLSFSIPYTWLHESGQKGIGDIFLNYRYQLTDENDWMHSSPRLSVILPTGNFEKGTGYGAWGVQTNFPFSKRISEPFISHLNIGATYYPGVKATDINGIEQKKHLFSYFLGTSIIWLAHPNFNVMIEYLFSRNEDFDDENNKITFSQHVICPGFRGAINLSELQVVPGLAFPVSFDGNNGKMDIFFYLSFEHPY